MCARFARGSWRYALPPALVGLFLLPFSLGAAAVAFLTGGAALGFHRDPERSPPADGLLAPADGKVSVIREEEGRLRVGVFMNLTDVHVNRAPLSGEVVDVTHSPGKHWPAFTKESDRNEKVRIEFEEYAVIQIAGAVARRIHPYVEPGDAVARGQRIGHISFSSRVDIVMPADVTRADLAVEKGDAVTAGETRLVDR
ncbi:protein sorting system archaetidylserine decarboxylase [Halorientalis halophila]|uniref:protein sorting system archaetidylserine decarboxylase n=1 Tax=Halorientalis halophila TaxID=3108499 RepID=UPI003007FADD